MTTHLQAKLKPVIEVMPCCLLQVVKEALYDAFYKLTDSKSQVCQAYKLMTASAAARISVCLSVSLWYSSCCISPSYALQIRSYVFDVVRGTVPKINLDDVFTVSICNHKLHQIDKVYWLYTQWFLPIIALLLCHVPALFCSCTVCKHLQACPVHPISGTLSS